MTACWHLRDLDGYWWHHADRAPLAAWVAARDTIRHPGRTNPNVPRIIKDGPLGYPAPADLGRAWMHPRAAAS
jgi:hypothetical protein